jgi:hypothetical protein
MEKFFCCCGLSGRFPICDGSQMIAKTHRAGKLLSCGEDPKPSDPPGDEAFASSPREVAAVV